MDRWKIAGIVVRISGTLIAITLLIYLYAVIRQAEEGALIVQPGTLMNVGDDKDERGTSVGNVRIGSAEDDVTAVCEMMQAMDFTVEQPHMELSEEEDRANYYDINGVDVGKEKWEELTAPFYEAIEHEIPTKTLTDVFGELLEAN